MNEVCLPPSLSTLIHLLELGVAAGLAIGIAFAAHRLFGVDLSAPLVVVLGFVFAGIGKYLRAAPDTGVPDYVNKPVDPQE